MDKQPTPSTKGLFSFGMSKRMKYAMIALGTILGAETIFLNTDFAHCKKTQLSCI